MATPVPVVVESLSIRFQVRQLVGDLYCLGKYLKILNSIKTICPEIKEKIHNQVNPTVADTKVKLQGAKLAGNSDCPYQCHLIPECPEFAISSEFQTCFEPYPRFL